MYFKLPYTGPFSNTTKIKLKQIFDKYCRNTVIAVAFAPLKIGRFLSCKVYVNKFIQSYVINLIVQAVMHITLRKSSAI